MNGNTERARRRRKTQNAKLRKAQAPVVVITVPGIRTDCRAQRSGLIGSHASVSRAVREALKRQALRFEADTTDTGLSEAPAHFEMFDDAWAPEPPQDRIPSHEIEAREYLAEQPPLDGRPACADCGAPEDDPVHKRCFCQLDGPGCAHHGFVIEPTFYGAEAG